MNKANPHIYTLVEAPHCRAKWGSEILERQVSPRERHWVYNQKRRWLRASAAYSWGNTLGRVLLGIASRSFKGEAFACLFVVLCFILLPFIENSFNLSYSMFWFWFSPPTTSPSSSPPPFSSQPILSFSLIKRQTGFCGILLKQNIIRKSKH